MNAGDRVRLHAPSPMLHLRGDLGSLVRRDERYGDLGYWVVRLDQPATYTDGAGMEHELDEVIELEDNLTRLS